MRGADITQEELFSYRTLEERVPKDHPLRKLRAVVDILLTTMDSELDALYAKTGRASIPPEWLLRASLLQVLFSIRSERQLVQQIDFNLLFRWFVGLSMDAAVWDHSTFSANRDRLLNETLSRLFFERVLAFAEWQDLLSDEHFSVDGTLIQAWASQKSFVKKTAFRPHRRTAPAIPRSISRARNGPMPPTPRPPIRMPASTRRARATRPNSVSWAMP
jgi:transposase